MVMKECDDIYLLRLVAQTGPVVKFLDEKTSFQVLNRVNKIVRSGSIQAMAVQWIEDANKQGLFQKMERKEQNEYLDSLYQCSKRTDNEKLMVKSQKIYEDIKKRQKSKERA
jgi:hypothetical protein